MILQKNFKTLCNAKKIQNNSKNIRKTIDISQKQCYYKGELREMDLVPVKYTGGLSMKLQIDSSATCEVSQ